jgi:hypothetical protein
VTPDRGVMSLPEGVFVDGTTAYELVSAMALAEREARRMGSSLSPRLVAAARAFEAVGNRWADNARATYRDRNIGIPTETTPVKVGAMGTVGTKEAAKMLGVSQRAVVGQANRGTLPGRLTGGVWVFALTDVTDTVEARKDRHAA